MVNNQLVARGISDPRVIGVFRQAPREHFVPYHLKNLAYADDPLDIGEGQTISQPYTVAFMTELLGLGYSKKHPSGVKGCCDGIKRVLEVGTGSGYQAAILAKIADKVFSVERIRNLADKAELRLRELGIRNVRIRVGDGTLGWPKEAPFDAIIVTAAAPSIPKPLFDQLKEGGRLVVPVGDQFVQEMLRVTKVEGSPKAESFGSFRFVPLVGECGWKKIND